MEPISYIRFLASLVLVLGLIFGVLWALRRFGVGGMVARPGGRRRLAMVEAMTVDNRRRLVLVRRDDREHLLLIGGTQDLLVESGIAAAADEVKGDGV